MSSQTGPVIVDLPSEWFEEAQRSVAALRSRLEQAEREIARREYDLELRERVLEERERLSEVGISTRPANQDLEAKMRKLDEEARQIAQQREALAKESVAFAARRKDAEAIEDAFDARERSLRALERDLSQREAQLETSQRELEALRASLDVSLSAPMDSVINATQGRSGPAAMETPDAPQSFQSRRIEETVRHMLDLRQVMETAASSVSAQESQAAAILANAAARARNVEVLERKVQEDQTRLATLRIDIVNAKKALMAVDSAITKMPSDVVDEFVQSEDFANYERAVKAFRRFAD